MSRIYIGGSFYLSPFEAIVMPRLTSKLFQYTGFVAAILLAVPANAESLETAVETALNNHPTVEAAIAARNAAIENQQEQFAGYFPRVRLNAATGRVYGDNSTSRGLSTTRDSAWSWQHEGGLTLTQMLFDGFKVGNRVDAAESRRKAANYDIVSAREELAYQTVIAYLGVLRVGEERARIKNYTSQIDDKINRIKSMVENGAAHEAELQQAYDLRLTMERFLNESERRLDVARIAFASLVGHYPEGDLALPEYSEGFIPDADAAVEYALKNHPSLVQINYRAEAVENDFEAEKGTLYPDLNAEVSYYKKDLSDRIGGEVVDAKGMLRMNWNFSLGGEQINRIQKKRYEYFNSLAKVAERTRQLEKEIRSAYAGMEATAKQHDVNERRAALHEAIVKVYKNQFEGGAITLLQLLQAENQYFVATMEEIAARYELLAAQHNVLVKAGRLQTALNVRPANHDKANIREGEAG